MQIDKFYYKGVLIGQGLPFEDSPAKHKQYLFEATEEFTKNRIPFFQRLNNDLQNGIFVDEEKNWRILNNENQYTPKQV